MINAESWQFHRPITMRWRDTPKFPQLRMFLKVLKTCGRHIQTSDMNLTEHVFSQFKGLGDTKIHLHKTCIDKRFIINVLHRGWHIHFLNNCTIKSMLAYSLQTLRQIDLFKSPTTHKCAIWYLRNTIR